MASDSETELRKTIETIELERRWRRDTYRERLRYAIGIAALTSTLFLILELLLAPDQMRGMLLWRGGLPLPPLLPTGTLCLAVFLVLWVLEPAYAYRKYLAGRKFPKIVRLFGPFEFKADGCVSLPKGAAASMLPAHSRAGGSAHFSAERGDVRIEFSRIRLGQGENGAARETARGYVILMTFSARKFPGLTVVERTAAPLAREARSKELGLTRAKFPEPRFETLFAAYSDEPGPARALLDPAILEAFSRLFDDLKATRVAAAFHGEHLLIFLETKHHFFAPPSLRTPVHNRRPFSRLRHDIEALYTIADKLTAQRS